MALPGMLMLMVGFQLTMVLPAMLVALTTGWGVAHGRCGDGVKVAGPVAG